MEVYFEIPPENKRHATVGKHQFYRPNLEARQLGKPALSSHPKYVRKQKKIWIAIMISPYRSKASKYLYSGQARSGKPSSRTTAHGPSQGARKQPGRLRKLSWGSLRTAWEAFYL